MEGAWRLEEHRRAHPDVALSMRSCSAWPPIARSKSIYDGSGGSLQRAIQAWPDDPLGRSVDSLGRLILESFHEPDAALELLEQPGRIQR